MGIQRDRNKEKISKRIVKIKGYNILGFIVKYFYIYY